MSSHLTPAECIDAMDGRLSGARLTHLHTCERCRADVASLAETAANAGSGEVPEPSPLFWDHQAARIAAAIATESPQTGARPLGRLVSGALLAAAAIAGMIVFVPRDASHRVPGATAMPPRPEVSLPAEPEDERAWSVVVAAGEGLDLDVTVDSLQPASDTVDLAVQDLDAQERDALAALLRVPLKPRS